MPTYRRTGKRKAGCPICNESKGEKAIAEYLKSVNVNFARQFTFPDCKNNFVLRFDFAILDCDMNPKAMIEYNGQQHYYANDFFGGEQSLADTQRNDEIKVSYCSGNDIPLLVVHYNCKNIGENVKNFLVEMKCLNIS